MLWSLGRAGERARRLLSFLQVSRSFAAFRRKAPSTLDEAGREVSGGIHLY